MKPPQTRLSLVKFSNTHHRINTNITAPPQEVVTEEDDDGLDDESQQQLRQVEENARSRTEEGKYRRNKELIIAQANQY